MTVRFPLTDARMQWGQFLVVPDINSRAIPDKHLSRAFIVPGKHLRVLFKKQLDTVKVSAARRYMQRGRALVVLYVHSGSEGEQQSQKLCAASCSGVDPLSSRASTSTPCPCSRRAIEKCPLYNDA